jgi:hypothetical protein
MAAVATLVLLNNAAANVNFLPDTIRTGEYAKYADRTQGSFVGTAYASITRKINPQPTGVRKIQAKLVVPTVDATSGLLKYQGLGTAELVMPNGMTLLEKQELYARFKSMIANAVFGNAVTTDDMPWG